jgi:hypothetical protein
MFTMPDKMIFMNEVDPSVVIRVVGEMNLIANEAASLDDAEKN